MKEIVNLNKTSSDNNYLGQSDFQSRDTIYLVNSDFTLRENIYLPYNSEIRIESGSLYDKEIFLPYDGQPCNNMSEYSMLVVIISERMLKPGTVIRSFDKNSFYLELYGNSRIALPEYGPESSPNAYSDNIRGRIMLKSADGSEIEIDGKTTLNFYAEHCNLKRVFISQNGFGFFNRSKIYDLDVVLENCRLWADEYADGLGFGDPKMPLAVSSQKDCKPARLTARDCVFDNVGLQGEVYVDNCKFLFGINLLNNNEQIHCGSHSRILNSYFDGRDKVLDEYDIIDTYNGGDIVIENCTFVKYKSTSPNPTLITIKSHYSTPSSPSQDTLTGWLTIDQPEDSDFKGQQTGVTVRNCYFDLPEFCGYIILVLNDLREGSTTERRDLNRQFSNIESNFIKARNAVFVGCLSFTDCTRIINNSGQVRILVYVGKKSKAHNLEIRNNWLVSNITEDDSMFILYGSNIDNLILSGNMTRGYIWGLERVELSGNIRITDNETVGTRGLFNFPAKSPFQASVSNGKDVSSKLVKEDGTVNYFFSGNVSKGKKTDVGSMEIANSISDGILFVGRQFFCTDGQFANQLVVYNGTSWVKA